MRVRGRSARRRASTLVALRSFKAPHSGVQSCISRAEAKKLNMEPFREARWVLPGSAGMLRDRRGVLEIWVPCVRKNIFCSNEPAG